MDSIALASIYRLTSVNFWESAKMIDNQIQKKSDGTPKNVLVMPFYFLVSHSIELFLKSALLKRGHIDTELKKYEYRHDLEKLLKLLQGKKLTISSKTIEIICKFSVYHKNHILRYNFVTDIDGITSIPTNLIFDTLEELLLLTRISTQGK